MILSVKAGDSQLREANFADSQTDLSSFDALTAVFQTDKLLLK